MASQGFGEVAESLRRSTVHVQTGGRGQGSGSGVIWSEDGLIVTNAHVARGGAAQIALWDGSKHEATLLDRRSMPATWRRCAFALRGCPRPPLAILFKPRVGELAHVAMGNPPGVYRRAGQLASCIYHRRSSVG